MNVDQAAATADREYVRVPHVSDGVESASSSSSSSAMKPHGEEDDGFVVVAKPIVTVRQFAQWIEQVRLPSANVAMRGAVEDDVILLLVNRRTFVNDVLRSFRGQLTAHGSVDDEAWPALWMQFKRDFPREEVVLNGERMDPNLDFDDILPRIRTFVACCLPDAVVRNMTSPAHRSSAGDATELLVAGVHEVLTLPFTLLSSVASMFTKEKKDAKEQPTSSTASSTDHLSSPAAPAPVLKDRDDVVEAYTRVVVLLSQQAVLALPLEVINAQFCQEVGAELFVGEVSRDDPVSATSGMRVCLTPHDAGAVLAVSKVFRVFSLADSVDYSLFYINMRVEVDLFSTDENISLVWKIIPADKPHLHLVHNVEAAPVAARRCECLGATSGYHKADCPLAPSGAGHTHRRS